MKKISFVAFLSLAGLAAFILVATAGDPANTACNDICSSPMIAAAVPSVGSCISNCNVCTNNGDTTATCVCKQLKDLGLLESLGFANQGDCVSALN